MLIKDSSIYSKLAENKGEKRDCCVRAFTIATGKPYDEIHDLHKKHGRKFRRGTFLNTTYKVCDDLGFEQVKLDKKISVKTFVESYPKGTFYVHKRGHAFAIVDGVVHDWANGTSERSRISFAAKSKQQEIKMELKIDGKIRSYRGFDLVKVKGMFFTHELFGNVALPLEDAKKAIDLIYRRLVLNCGTLSKDVPSVMKSI